MVQLTKENGKMINRMGKGEKYGLMVQSLEDLMQMVLKMDLENLNGEMGVFMLEIL